MGDIFKVEKVLQKRDFNGKTQYLIKWANFPESANTWEPDSNVLPFISKQIINRDIEEHRRLLEELENAHPQKEMDSKREEMDNLRRDTPRRMKRKS